MANYCRAVIKSPRGTIMFIWLWMYLLGEARRDGCGSVQVWTLKSRLFSWTANFQAEKSWLFSWTADFSAEQPIFQAEKCDFMGRISRPFSRKFTFQASILSTTWFGLSSPSNRKYRDDLLSALSYRTYPVQRKGWDSCVQITGGQQLQRPKVSNYLAWIAIAHRPARTVALSSLYEFMINTMFLHCVDVYTW